MLSGFSDAVNQRWEEPITKTKPFSISKKVVWEAYRRVKANRGAAGIDGQSIKDFGGALQEYILSLVIQSSVKNPGSQLTQSGSTIYIGSSFLMIYQ